MENDENSVPRPSAASSAAGLGPVRFGRAEFFGSLVISEAIAWLLFLMVRVNAPELPIPEEAAKQFSSFTAAIVLALALPPVFLAGLFAAYLAGKIARVLFQAAKFALVGALNTFVDLGVLNGFILVTGIASGPLFPVFKGISFITAVLNSYVWNKYWTFGRTKTSAGREFPQFFAVSVVGFFLNVGTATILVNMVGAPEGLSEKLWASTAALIAVLVSMVWNFVGYKFWVFRR